MVIPEKISEALIQTDIKMKSFRKAMLVLLFEWQNLETRLDLTDKCFKETFPLQDSAFQTSPESSSIRLSIETRLNEVEQKERDFRSFQEIGMREMEIREDKLGFIRKEINLREKKVEEREGLIELERRSIEMRIKENQAKEEELVQRVKEFEFKKEEFEKMKKEFELREKEGDFKDKMNTPTGSAVFRIAGPSNQSMALVNVSETSSANQQISKGRLRSKAWLHFTKIAKGVGSNDTCKCNYCHRIFTLCGGGTSQLLRHISEGRCAAYQKIHSALPLDETLSQTHSQRSVQEPLVSRSNVGENTRTPLIKGYEESVKQEPATVLLEPELKSTQPHMERHMPTPRTCAIHNTALCECNYQPQQLKDPSEDQSDPSFDQQPPGMRNHGVPPPLRGSSVSLASNDNLVILGDSDQYSQETQLRDKGSSDIYENASGDSSEELQMFTHEVKMSYSVDQRNQNRKRERERGHTIEQNESSNVFLNSDIDDLPSPPRKHCSSKLFSGDDENTEEVLHEVDPVSCIMPIDPARDFYGHMMNQKDHTHEENMPE